MSKKIINLEYKNLHKFVLNIILVFIFLFSASFSIFATNENKILIGDLDNNNSIGINDLAILKLKLIGKTSLNESQLYKADLNKDGNISIEDLAILKLITLGKMKPIYDVIEPEITVPDTKFKGFDFQQIKPENTKVTYERINFQNKKQQEYNITGAGSQWPVSLETSADGSLMLYGIDVAGIYKSTDHGKTWELATSGFAARGIGMSAIDPFNSNHVVALGLGNRKNSGIYVSYNKAQTWNKTKNELHSNGERYLWDGLEFDPTSYNEETRLTTDIYYSTPYQRDTTIRQSPTTSPQSKSPLQEKDVGLYKSSDGGEEFELIINDKKLADGIIRITEKGELYVGNQYGLFLIDKENYTISKSYLINNPNENYSQGITGLDVVGNTIYAQTWNGIYTLENDELSKITNENYHSTQWPQFLTVSKSNPNHMIYQYRTNVNNYYVNTLAISFDKGETWESPNVNIQTTFYKSSWTGREKLTIIDPSNDNNIITFGSDTLLRSEDGGRNFVQASGISNMMQGGKFNFNYYDPDLILFSAQDYTGVVTTDGGKTFEKLVIPGKGNFYGGFAADKYTYFGFANTTWGGGTLTITHDGGDTWIDTGLTASGVPQSQYYSSLQSPTNPDILFACEYYSKDRGYTWNKMNGCVSVFTFNYINKQELYGANEDGKIVVSYNNGDTWQTVSNEPWENRNNVIKETILDIAYDHINNYIYVVHQVIWGNAESPYTLEQIFKLDANTGKSTKLNIPVDNDRGYMRQKSIAIDPNSTSVIYVGGAGGAYSSATALIRSIDGGENWEVLTTANYDKYEVQATNQGGYEITNIRVNPYDGMVWISSGCYGYEKFNPPYNSALLKHTKPLEHTIKYVYNNKVVHEEKIKNNNIHNYIYDENGLTFVDWYTDKELTKAFSNGSKVYNSTILYAKMEESIRIRFYDRETLLSEMDLDDYDQGSKEQIPTRNGYAFAGWYIDKELTQKVDFKTIKSDCNVYAGWYKVEAEIFDPNRQDIGDYISYQDHKIQDKNFIDNDVESDDRSILMAIEPNSTYLITFKMDTRFRMGITTNNFWQYNVVPNYYIDENDNNGRIPANKYVYKTFTTDNKQNQLLIYYYTSTGTKQHMEIKNTFKIYKITSDNVQENNN